MRHRSLILAALIAVPLSFGRATGLEAQEDTPPLEDSLPATHATTPPWRHHVSFLAGAAHSSGSEGTTSFVIRGSYEYRFHAWYGIGAIAEGNFGTPRDLVIGPGFSLHPARALRVTMVVGGELDDGAWAFLYRISGDYDIPMGSGWTLAPSLALDFARGRRVLVAGAGVGYSF